MHRLASLGVFLVVVLLGGSLAAPWLWWAVQSWAASPEAPAWVGTLARHPFHRYVHRCLLVFALIGMIPLARHWGIRSWRDLGLAGDGSAVRGWWRGAGLGFAMFALILLAEIAWGIRAWRAVVDPSTAVTAIARALASGITVGTLEEILFRGVLLGGLSRTLEWWKAVFVSSAVYSLVHFFQRPPVPASVTWLSGVELLGGMLKGWLTVERLIPAALTLFIAGILLSRMYQKSRTLYCSMGLHSGWVFWIKLRGWITVQGPNDHAVQPRTGIVSGWSAFWVVGIVTLLMLAWDSWKPRERVPIAK